MSRDYLERTIATVRNHRDADNCWPQWANIFADEIERLWRIERAAEDHIEEWEKDADDADAAADTYERGDEAGVALHREANRARGRARELRRILAAGERAANSQGCET